jgi:hypothetical protein
LIALLIGDVDALVAAGALNHGQGNALESKLEAARRALARGDLQKTRDDLNAFIKQVEALMKSPLLAVAEPRRDPRSDPLVREDGGTHGRERPGLPEDDGRARSAVLNQ